MIRGTWVVGAIGCFLFACSDDTGTTSGASLGGSTSGASSTGAGTSTGAPDTTGEPEPTGGATGTGTGTSDGSGSTSTGTTEAITSSDGSSSTGAPAFCGDGAVDPGEECDEGASNSDAGTCTAACKSAVCGDGLLGPGEACDDGNTDDADACTNACAPASCGDAIVQMGEACDDGNTDDTDACLTNCAAASCGDGFVQAGVEECDDGNLDDADDCSACKNATCSDAIKNGTETDVDCGGGCPKCDVGAACGGQGDCGDGLLCEANVCTYPASCKALKDAVPDAPSGFVVVDFDGGGPEAPLEVYCEQTYFGGGWMRLMSAKYPHFFNDMTWQSFNADQPQQENYSIVGKRDLFKVGENYTFRYAVGDAMNWKDGPILFQVAWTQGHDPFTKTTTGADYMYLSGNKPTTCGGFNGLHAKYNAPSYATDVDTGDGIGCWWMQVVPRDDWKKYGYPAGYLHGFLGGGNLDPKHETQWEVLYIR